MKSKAKKKGKAKKKPLKGRTAAAAANQSAGANTVAGRAAAIAAAEGLGVKFNAKGKITNGAEVQKMAYGAAASAAASMGVNIMKADGSIDDTKVREAVSAVLGFSAGKDGVKDQAEAAKEMKNVAVEMAASLGVNILDAKGNVDSKKALKVAEISLTAGTLKRIKEGRSEALTALNLSQNSFAKATNRTRQEAAAVVDKLLNSSVIKDGIVDREAALKSLEAAVALSKTDEFLAKNKKQLSRQEASRALLGN